MRGGDNRLVPDSADFHLLTTSDLPAAWLVSVSTSALDYAAHRMGLPPSSMEASVVVELPDFPWAWKYYRWAQSQHEAGALPLMLVGSSEFWGQDEASRHVAAVESLRCLLATGKPVPFFARVFVPRR